MTPIKDPNSPVSTGNLPNPSQILDPPITCISSVPNVPAINATGDIAGSFSGNVSISGNLTMTGANSDIILSGADCAEDFDVAAASNAEPGTVMVLDGGGLLQESRNAYDKRVAGVVCGGGKFRPGIILGRGNEQLACRRAPIALAGKVYCKVDAEYAPIVAGDLLTTSATRGHAMKAEDSTQAFGAVVGKALASVPNGTGLIPILVTLQ